MIVATYTLTFPDGDTITAEIRAETPDREYPVCYSGAVERLPRKYATGDTRVLRVWADSIAKENGAAASEKIGGMYDRWAW